MNKGNILSKRLKPGDIFGQWLVIEPHYVDGKIKGHKCQCQCNAKTIRVVHAGSLTNGTSTSCGCVRKELLATNNPMFNPEIAEKVSVTRKHNGIVPTKQCRDAAQSDSAKKKRINTNQKRYGGNSPAVSDEVKNNMPMKKVGIKYMMQVKDSMSSI
jgi:hypothetical protein